MDENWDSIAEWYAAMVRGRSPLHKFAQDIRARDFDIAPWSRRASAHDAHYTDSWKPPILGEVAAPEAVLVRPDSYVAWVGDRTTSGLPEALNRWFT